MQQMLVHTISLETSLGSLKTKVHSHICSPLQLQPPYPINLILKKQQLEQIEGMLQSLAEAADKQPVVKLPVNEDADEVSEELLEPGWVMVSAAQIAAD